MNLTKASVEKITPPLSGQAFYRDDELKGFALRVTSGGIKTYVVERRIKRKVRRITIARTNVMSAENARKRAQILLGHIAEGRDPVAEKAISEARSVTLSQCFEAFLKARKDIKPKTESLYRSALEGLHKKTEDPLGLANWKDKALVDITADMVERRHKKLGEERGEAWANLVMRTLRTMFTFAEAKYEDVDGKPVIAVNPVRKLSRVRAWYASERRENYIKLDQLSKWYDGVQKIKSSTGRDYLLTVVLTGLRREEAARLRWQDIDFNNNTIRICETKNGDTHVLPLSTQLKTMLEARHKEVKGEWVFPGTGNGSHIVEPKKFTAAVANVCGIKTSIHDLRRTFATLAESLDVSTLALKRLLNHRTAEADVTAGYVVLDIERLRKPMQLISNVMWGAMMAKGNNVLPLDREHAAQ